MVAPEIKSEAAILVQDFCGLGGGWLNVWDIFGIIWYVWYTWDA